MRRCPTQNRISPATFWGKLEDVEGIFAVLGTRPKKKEMVTVRSYYDGLGGILRCGVGDFLFSSWCNKQRQSHSGACSGAGKQRLLLSESKRRRNGRSSWRDCSRIRRGRYIVVGRFVRPDLSGSSASSIPRASVRECLHPWLLDVGASQCLASGIRSYHSRSPSDFEA